MTKYFFTDTRHSDAEREMMIIPNFNKDFTKKLVGEFTGCNSCLLLEKGCDPKTAYTDCPLLLERLLSGGVDRLQALIQARFEQVTPPTHLFLDSHQKERFKLLSRKMVHNSRSRESKALLYILSADSSLFTLLMKDSKSQTLDQHINNLSSKAYTLEAYTLLCITKDLLFKTNYTSQEDYADREIVSDYCTAIIFCAFLILNYGIGVGSPLKKYI